MAALTCKGPSVKINFSLERCATSVLMLLRLWSFTCSTLRLSLRFLMAWLFCGKARTSAFLALTARSMSLCLTVDIL